MILILHASPAGGQSDALSLAARTEKTDPAAALKLYKSAFEKAGTPDAAFASFEGVFRLEHDFASLVLSCQDLVARVKDAPFPAGLALRIGRFFEISGRLNDALAIYMQQIAQDGSPETDAAALALCVEMNDLDSALRITASLRASAESEGQVALQSGDTAAARAAFEKILSTSPGKGAALRALYGLYAAARAEGDQEGMKKAADTLIAAYPKSPEAAIARSKPANNETRIVLAPMPAQSLSREPPASSRETPQGSQEAPTQPAAGQEPDPAAQQASGALVSPQSTVPQTSAPSASAGPEAPRAAAPAAQQAPSAPSRISVQAGSYRVRENAEDMVRELGNRGFNAVVREVSVGGVPYYKALACEAVDPDEARKVLARLRESGFEGVLLVDTP